jgi:multidrug efflux pump subunit AcrB
LPLGALLQIFGITMPQFISYRSPAPIVMGLPLGIIYLALAVWLIGKGFSAQPKSFAT